jgi:hypothetical protein
VGGGPRVWARGAALRRRAAAGPRVGDVEAVEAV